MSGPTQDRRDVVTVEITFVVLSSVLMLVLVGGAEWAAWRVFALTSRDWQRAGIAIVLVAVVGLFVRAVRLLREVRS